jgi:hypothetical protein
MPRLAGLGRRRAGVVQPVSYRRERLPLVRVAPEDLADHRGLDLIDLEVRVGVL